MGGRYRYGGEDFDLWAEVEHLLLHHWLCRIGLLLLVLWLGLFVPMSSIIK